jgi:uncharacterized RDD family membrane protein YckC
LKWRDAKKRKQIEKKEIQPEVIYGEFRARAFAIVMDSFLLLAPITIITGFIFGYDALKDPELNQNAGNFQMFAYMVVTVAFWRVSRQTPGKKAFGIEIVDAKTLSDASLLQLVIRFTAYFLSMITLIGFFIPLFRKDRRALHDLISRTAVIEKR